MMKRWMAAWMALGLAGVCAEGETLAERLWAGYGSVKTLQCEMRRDKPLPDGGTMRMYSRVLFEAPNKLNAENVMPVERRTVSDGVVFRQWGAGMKKGFSRRVEDLEGEMKTNLEMLPGSNANLLKPLLGAEEEDLGGGRKGYAVAHGYVVLGTDAEGRWTTFEVYGSRTMDDCKARAEYGDFEEVGEGVWIAKKQETTAQTAAGTAKESVRISKLRAGVALPAAAFDGASFFPGVEFADTWEGTR